MMPSVSVIIPAYNCEKDICVTLDSLLAQTYKDWQAIVVVAPSDDNTLDAVRQYSWDRRILVVVETEKTNVATARNDGLYLATGRYVSFLDAGDWWVKAKLSCCIYLIADTGISWCYHHMIIHEGGSERLWAERPGQSVGIEGLHTVVVRREVLDEIKNTWGYVFNEKMNRADDADLVLRLRNYPSVQIPIPLSHCYVNPKGLTATTTRTQNTVQVISMAIRNGAWFLIPYHVKNYLLYYPVLLKRRYLD